MSDNEGKYEVVVPQDLSDLIPVFLENRKKELQQLRVAVIQNDFEQLRQIGHRMKGVGVPYGFDRVSEIGKHIQDAGTDQDRQAAENHLAQYSDFLANLRVVYG